jgi:hypothetical protein
MKRVVADLPNLSNCIARHTRHTAHVGLSSFLFPWAVVDDINLPWIRIILPSLFVLALRVAMLSGD